MQDDLFGLDALTVDTGGRTTARWAAGGLGVVFLILSAITTFGFYATYAAGIGNLAGPELAPFIAGAIGVICLDLGALLWGFVRARGADTTAQMALAGIVAAVDLVGSLITSGLYVALQSSFDVGIYGPSGELTDLGAMLHLLGVTIVTMSLIVNFAAVALWAHLSASTRSAAQASALRATVDQARYQVATLHAESTLRKTIHELGGQLPAVTDEAARRNAERYLRAARMPYQAHENSPQATQPAEPSPNGSAHFLR